MLWCAPEGHAWDVVENGITAVAGVTPCKRELVRTMEAMRGLCLFRSYINTMQRLHRDVAKGVLSFPDVRCPL